MNKLCQACGAQNDADCKFCTTCGAALGQRVANTALCPRCRATLPADSKFCGKCGFVLTQPLAQEPREPAVPAPPLVASPQVAPPVPKAVIVRDTFGVPLTEWRQGRYRSVPGESDGAPGLVWLYGKWLEPVAAAEELAKLEKDLASIRSEFSAGISSWREKVWMTSLEGVLPAGEGGAVEGVHPGSAGDAASTAIDDWLTEGLLPCSVGDACRPGPSTLAEALAGCVSSTQRDGVDALSPNSELCWLLAEALRADSSAEASALELAEVAEDGQAVVAGLPEGFIASPGGPASVQRLPLAEIAPSTQSLFGAATRNVNHASHASQ